MAMIDGNQLPAAERVRRVQMALAEAGYPEAEVFTDGEGVTVTIQRIEMPWYFVPGHVISRAFQVCGLDWANMNTDHELTYGSVPVEEFDKLRAAAAAPIDLKPTFREDYEIYGADEGEVFVSYSGGCSVCGAKCKFEFSQAVI